MINTNSFTKLTVCCFIFFFAAVAECFAQASFQIVPGVKAGAINARTSEADLRKIYGRKNVRAGEIGLGEGETVPGTIIFPNDPQKRLEIVWKNKKLRKNPEFVQIFGDKSLWKLSHGIGLGTSLKTLERLNGKSFTLLGFQWDYSGTITDWNGGKLARTFGKDGRLATIRLSPQNYEDKTLAKDLDAVVGDGDFSSANKSMQKINPKIYFIIVNFP